MAEIDLSHFCCLEPARHYVMQPWTRGGFTYATDGHIMVRVPARDDVPANPDAPDAERVLAQVDFATCSGSPLPRLPPIRFRLEDLSETGDPLLTFTLLARETISFRGAAYQLHLMHLMFWLPEVEIGRSQAYHAPLPFRFAGGGVGVVMPVKADPATYDLDALARRNIDAEG